MVDYTIQCLQRHKLNTAFQPPNIVLIHLPLKLSGRRESEPNLSLIILATGPLLYI